MNRHRARYSLVTSGVGIVPMQNGTGSAERVSFSGWYEAWLDKSLAA
jgi:hypothetical protein